MTAGKGIKAGAHLILGFPTETRDDMLAMSDELSRLPLGFLKLHQLQVIKNTALADLYAAEPFATLGYGEYIALVADFLERLSPDIVLQRLFAAAPGDILVAPVWNKTRSEFLNDLDAYLERKEIHQGKKHKAKYFPKGPQKEPFDTAQELS
jgi:radical SAM superfamily enzyme